ncbi:182 kDa tankyrase-1-binding protein isoform X2 [Nannospalax galili]|uniref:182 kDa tankyrase-1-binding protein isoform X2 n=1 Tax=Nannospalax galili TaxID=1026970 RepID=UPI0004ED32F6|nr:182 kDa tankyrase-1-binding protein isoform X2 [Nannospalax galili]
MKISTLRESTAMASPPPQEMEEELVPVGSEPGDPRAKPPVKPKPRALPSKPALPAKPSLLVPVGPRPPRGPLAELPSARKMNMLAGPQPYGGSKRPLPFAPRLTAEASAGEITQESGKEEGGKEDLPPLTPPARCAAPGGVRKAPAPFRPSSERFAASTVEEILAKMEQPRKEVPASPDRLWGSRLTFNHDGSSRYGPRTYGVVTGSRQEDDKTPTRAWSQEGPAKSPAECQEEHSQIPEERSNTSSLAVNGDLAKLARSEPSTEVSKSWVASSPGPISEHGGSSSPILPAPGSPHPSSHPSSPQRSHFSEVQSPAAPDASLCCPVTIASPSAALPDEGPCHPPSPDLPSEVTPETPRSNSPPVETVHSHHSPEQPPPISPQPLIEGGDLLHLTRTFPCGEEAVAKGHSDPCPSSLTQRRFSEGVLRPPSQDQEKFGGSLAALPQAQGSQSALDRPFGSGTESNWSLSQSFEWTFPTRPSGLGVWRLDSPPPSPITEASEAAEAAEAGNWAVSGREEGVSQQRSGAPSAPESPGRHISGVEGPSGTPLLQAEERYEDQGPLAGQETPLPLATREAALPVLEPILGQQQPTPPDQPCVLFADAPDPGQALPAEEETVTLAWAETTQPRTEAHDSCRASPEPTGPDTNSRWLDDLLASPPPSSGSTRRGASSELKDAQSPSTCPEGLLGWAQKDLQSEFGVAADPHAGSFRSASWSQDASQNYSLGGKSPGGDPGPGERDWGSKYVQGAGEGSSRDWASRCSLGQEVRDVSSSQNGSEVSVHEWAVGKPAQFGTQSPETNAQEWEFRKRDSQGTYSSRDKELQDQEFGKRDSLGSYGSREASLQDWEFGKRDSLSAYTNQDAGEQGQELGMKGHPGSYSSRDAEEQDREFEKRNSLLDICGTQATAQQDQEFGKSAWLQDYSTSGSRALNSRNRGFGTRALNSGFSPEEAQQQDEEFEKKTPSGEDSLHETSRGAGQPEVGESGDLLSPSTSKLQDGAIRQRDQGNWQDGDSSQEITGLQGRTQAGGQSPDTTELEDKETGQRGWPGEFSLGVTAQSEGAFSSRQPDWSRDLCMEATEGSYQFGIIGNDRSSGAGASPSRKMGGGHFVSPGESRAGAVDWTDQLGLRNLEVSSCVGSGGSSEARENAVGQMGWSDSLDLTHCLGTGGSEEPRGMGVGEKDWISDVGVKNRDLPGLGEVGGYSQPRESGVGEPDWSGVEAGEFLKSRERGVGQADWTPDLGLRNMAPGAGCSPGEPRELGVGQVDWSDNLGLSNLEVPCDLESGSSRGCGVGQMAWAQDLGLRNTELSGPLSEVREHGVGKVGPELELDFRNTGSLSPGLETRELGVGETSGPETRGEDGSSPSLETRPEDPGMETEAPGLRASPSRCLARSPPSGSQSLLEGMLAASNSKAATRMDSAASGLRVLLEEEGATAGAGQGEPQEPSRDLLPSSRPQPDGEASRTEGMDGTWGLTRARQGDQEPAPTPRRPLQGPLSSYPSEDFSFMEDTEILDSAMYRSRANLGRKRGHRAPAIRPGGTLGLSESADSDARLFQDSTEPRASRVPSSDEEVVEEPQSRRTRMSLGTKGLKVNLFPGLSPSALKAKLRSRNRSAEEGEATENKSSQKESSVQRSKSCKVPGLGKPLALPPKPEKSSGSEGSSPNWLQALKLKKKKV